MPRAQKEKKDKKEKKEKKEKKDENEEEPTDSKAEKAKWTDSKVRFTLNEFIAEKEKGNMLGTTWKPIAFANVTTSYNKAYPEEPMTKRQIKNMYTGVSTYNLCLPDSILLSLFFYLFREKVRTVRLED
jgi:hypothetical protein